MKDPRHDSSPAAANPDEGRPQHSYRPWMGMLTLVIILALLLGFWSYSEHLIGTLERQAGRITSLQSELRVHEDILSILRTEGTVAIPLTSSSSFSHLSARMFFDQATGSVVINLANAPELADSVVQLWILDDTTAAGYLFRTSGSSALWGVTSVKDLAVRPGRTFLLTIEPRGGSARPSQNILARGSLN